MIKFLFLILSLLFASFGQVQENRLVKNAGGIHNNTIIGTINSNGYYTSNGHDFDYNLISRNMSSSYLRGVVFEQDNYYIGELLSLNPSDTISTNTYSPMDDRIVADATLYPYRCTGTVVATYRNKYDNTDTELIGTGFMVGSNIMLTAAHVVHNDGTKYPELYEFPYLVEFALANNDYSSCPFPFGMQIVTKYIFEREYFENTQIRDWACCVLDSSIGNTVGWYDKMSKFYEYNEQVFTYGYPDMGTGLFQMYEKRGLLGTKNNTNMIDSNINSSEGQSGSPVFVERNGQIYVIGILVRMYEYTHLGIMQQFDSLIYGVLNSFMDSVHTSHLNLRVIGKNGNTWKIGVTNNNNYGLTIYYNSKTCFENDARNWTGLNHVQSIYVEENKEVEISISNNLFARYITISFYSSSGRRWVAYANELNSSPCSLTRYYNIIDL